MAGTRNPLLLAILAGIAGCGDDTYDAQGCRPVADTATECPAHANVRVTELSVDGISCEDEIQTINGEGVLSRRLRPSPYPDQRIQETVCCYPVTVLDRDDSRVVCATPGRPFFEQGELRSARLSERRIEGQEPSARARAWARAGAQEHASVASFSRLALELMALGAPTSLLAGVHRAALDEIRHAEVCWSLARGLGLNVDVGPFPFEPFVRVQTSLEELTVAAVREGCVAETLGAHLLRAAADAAPEATTKRALEQLAREESEHAVLSYRVVAWAIAQGGPSVRAAAAKAFGRAAVEFDLDELALRAGVDAPMLRAALNRGISEVLEPAAAALLAA